MHRIVYVGFLIKGTFGVARLRYGSRADHGKVELSDESVKERYERKQGQARQVGPAATFGLVRLSGARRAPR
jgi:hypothetical protein